MYKSSKESDLGEPSYSNAKSISSLVGNRISPNLVNFNITSNIIGYTRINGFSKMNGISGDIFEVPLYEAILTGQNGREKKFRVIRFGVMQEDKNEDYNTVGLADEQSYYSNKWYEGYNDLGDDNKEKGAWKVTGNFKIIDGVDKPETQISEAYGHVEICGENNERFSKLNNLISDWTGALDKGYHGSSAFMYAVNNKLLKINIDQVEKPTPRKLNDTSQDCSLLEITDKISGYTYSKVYGYSIGGNMKKIIVPTYEMILYDYEHQTGIRTKITSFHITRDGWYNQGQVKIKGITKNHLVNRTSEPIFDDTTFRLTGTIGYAGGTLGAFALPDFGADPTPDEWYKDEYGTDVDEEVVRENKFTAKEVMIHVGGYYQNKSNKYALAGTYGCFGVVHSEQVFNSYREAVNVESEFNKIKDNGTKQDILPYATSNSEMKRLVNKLPRRPVILSIIKRDKATFENEKFVDN